MQPSLDSYIIDPARSHFVVQAFVTGMLSRLGHSPTFAIRNYQGEAILEPEPSLSMRIEAASLAVTDRVSDKDRREMERTMFDEVLEVRRYREILYQSTKAWMEGGQAKVEGELTLHGVTRPQSLTAQVELTGESLRAQGQFAVLQSAYDIKPVRVAGGTLKLKDELQCSFDIVARRQVEGVPGAA